MAFDASARQIKNVLEINSFNFEDPFAVVDSLKSPCSASMSGIGSLLEYLKQAPLDSSLNLDPAGKLHFHWANWSHTCQLQRELHAGNPARLDALEKSLSSLKRIEVWIKSSRGTILTSLHELYESYLDPRLRVSLFGQNTNEMHEREILYSDVGEAGPFSRLAAMKWFDKNIYGCFVFRKILLGFVPQRQFRLGASIPVVWWLKSSPLDAITTTLHQVSQRGVLFKVENRSTYSRLFHGSEDHAIIHFPLAFLLSAKSPAQTLKTLKQNETVALRLDGSDLSSSGAWQRGGGSQESYFFIKSETLLGDRVAEFNAATESFQRWFAGELK